MTAVVTQAEATTEEVRVSGRRSGRRRNSSYPYWFYLPAAAIYTIFFLVPTLVSFYFAFTRWDLFTSHWIGLSNFRQFFQEQSLVTGMYHTLIYAVLTSGLKVVIGMLLAVLLTAPIIARGYLRSVIFFPVLVSTIGVGLTFTILMDPEKGIINHALSNVGVTGPAWRNGFPSAVVQTGCALSGVITAPDYDEGLTYLDNE